MSVAATATASLGRQASLQQREKIVQDSLPAVKFLAKRLAARLPVHVDVDDLMQAGLMGLLQAVDRFDPRRAVKFQTYANRRVEGAMLDYLRSLDWKPRSVRERHRRLEKALAAVRQRLGTSATEEDVAAEIGISAPQLRQWMEDCPRASASTADCFRAGRADEDAKDYLADVADPADSPETALEKAQMRHIVTEGVDGLPGNERTVLSLYYYRQLTMKQIGQLLGVKQARVSQLHSKAVLRLRNRMRIQGSNRGPFALRARPATSAGIPR